MRRPLWLTNRIQNDRQAMLMQPFIEHFCRSPPILLGDDGPIDQLQRVVREDRGLLETLFGFHSLPP
jgi:hypothetical protein